MGSFIAICYQLRTAAILQAACKKQLKAGALLADNDDRGIARQRAISA